MEKVLIAFLASAGAAFAALAPMEADSVSARVKNDDALHVSDNRVAGVIAPACRIEMHWKYDYAGKPYLKKIRVCA